MLRKTLKAHPTDKVRSAWFTQTPLDDDANLYVCEKALAPFYVAFFSLFFLLFAKQRGALYTIEDLFV